MGMEMFCISTVGVGIKTTHGIKLDRTKYTVHTNQYGKTGEISVRCVNYVNLNILIVMLYFYTMLPWGELGKA